MDELGASGMAIKNTDIELSTGGANNDIDDGIDACKSSVLSLAIKDIEIAFC